MRLMARLMQRICLSSKRHVMILVLRLAILAADLLLACLSQSLAAYARCYLNFSYLRLSVFYVIPIRHV